MNSLKNESYIQVGVIAFREPNGDFKPAMPIYLPATPELEAREQTFVKLIEDMEVKYLSVYIEARKKLQKEKRARKAAKERKSK